jgi:hypothetical protein
MMNDRPVVDSKKLAVRLVEDVLQGLSLAGILGHISGALECHVLSQDLKKKIVEVDV